MDNAEYYESKTATASDEQGDLTKKPETVTHTRNGHFEQKLLSHRTILVVPHQQTQRLTKRLRQIYWRHRLS